MIDDDLRQNYASGDFDGTLKPGRKPALVIIDFVRAYLDPDAPLYADVDDELASAVRIYHAARKAGIPVIFTNVAYHEGGADGGVFFRKLPALRCFEAGNKFGDFPPELTPADGDILVTKQYASAFFGTSFAATLTAMNVDTLMITGVSTSGCVRATALDACQHGFIPLVIRDAVGDRADGPHEANLFDLQAKYAEVISEQSALDYMSTIS